MARADGLSRTKLGWGRTPFVQNAETRSLAPSSDSPSDPWHAAHISASTPPARPVATRAIPSCPGPMHPPTAAHSFKSPMPIPRSQQSTPVTAIASAMPPILYPIPFMPQLAVFAMTPAAKNGSTSQFGIASTVRTGHHAIECMFIGVRQRKRIGLSRARPSLAGVSWCR